MLALSAGQYLRGTSLHARHAWPACTQANARVELGSPLNDISRFPHTCYPASQRCMARLEALSGGHMMGVGGEAHTRISARARARAHTHTHTHTHTRTYTRTHTHVHGHQGHACLIGMRFRASPGRQGCNALRSARGGRMGVYARARAHAAWRCWRG